MAAVRVENGEKHMKRWLSVLGVAALVAVGLVLSPSDAKLAVASGCVAQWQHEEWTVEGSKPFISTYTGGTDYLNIVIEVKIELIPPDCRVWRLYAYSMWTSFGTPIYNPVIRGRFWVCGSNNYSFSVNATYTYAEDGPYNSCDEQADSWYNQYSEASSTYNANGNPLYVYTSTENDPEGT
jgi:hypothetical protein